MLSACSRFIGVGRSAFLLFYRHEFHPAFRAISRMISYDFGMHLAGVLLDLLLLARRAVGRRGDRRRVLVLDLRAIEVNRPYLCGGVRRERDSHR